MQAGGQGFDPPHLHRKMRIAIFSAHLAFDSPGIGGFSLLNPLCGIALILPLTDSRMPLWNSDFNCSDTSDSGRYPLQSAVSFAAHSVVNAVSASDQTQASVAIGTARVLKLIRRNAVQSFVSASDFQPDTVECCCNSVSAAKRRLSHPVGINNPRPQPLTGTETGAPGCPASAWRPPAP